MHDFDAISMQISMQICDQIWKKIWKQIWKQIFDQILKQICDQIFEAARKAPFLVKNACVVGGSFLAGAIEPFGSHSLTARA